MLETGSQAPTTSKYHKAAFTLRMLVGFGILSFNGSLFWETPQVWQWLVVIPHSLLYPGIVYMYCNSRECEQRTILLDAFFHGYYISLWGFNPLVICIFFSSSIVTSISNGGLRYLRVSLILSACGMIFGALLHGMYYRSELPLISTVLALMAVFLYLGLVSYVFYTMAQRLRRAKQKAREQHEELININNITNAASSTLNLNGVMKGLMQVLGKIYPLESVFVMSYDTHKLGIDMLGCHGEAITPLENKAFKKFTFDAVKDRACIYVKGMEDNQIIYYPKVDVEYIKQGAMVEQDLYAVKPYKSIAFFPIAVRGKVIAGVSFVNFESEMVLTTKDLDKIKGYLIQIGTAIRNVRMFYDVRRTRDMAKRARNQAEIEKRKAEESEDAKSHFLANMSHEIRTPMTAILGYSEALTDEETTEEERNEYTQIIVRSGKHLLSIINDILDISKIEASKIEIEELEVNLVQLISDIEAYAQIKAKEKGLDFKLNVAYPIPTLIKTDPTRLKQIIFNLMNNAVKFTEEGEITVDIQCLQENKLSVVVADTGIGLTRSEQDKLFKPFSQADASVTRVHGGTGLGLYISQSLARLMNGDIELTSVKGEGSSFNVVTGFEVVGDRMVTSHEEFKTLEREFDEEKENTEIPSLSGRVLIAEDNPENQKLVKRIVERTGLDVSIASNGREAVLDASYQTYDLIFLDMQMPLMGGKEAAKRILDLGITVPMVAFTANVMKHQVKEYKEIGFVDVVEKPISQEKIYRVLRANLIQEQREREHGEVLIVEDNTVNQMVMKRLVAKANDNLNISLAENGKEALDLAANTQFDLVLMDMEMPIMGGLEATQRLRSTGFKGAIYIVTGNIDPEYVRECENAGADGHLAKPIDKEHLYRVVDAMFK